MPCIFVSSVSPGMSVFCATSSSGLGALYSFSMRTSQCSRGRSVWIQLLELGNCSGASQVLCSPGYVQGRNPYVQHYSAFLRMCCKILTLFGPPTLGLAPLFGTGTPTNTHCNGGIAHAISLKWHLSDTYWLFRYAHTWWPKWFHKCS